MGSRKNFSPIGKYIDRKGIVHHCLHGTDLKINEHLEMLSSDSGDLVSRRMIAITGKFFVRDGGQAVLRNCLYISQTVRDRCDIRGEIAITLKTPIRRIEEKKWAG